MSEEPGMRTEEREGQQDREVHIIEGVVWRMWDLKDGVPLYDVRVDPFLDTPNPFPVTVQSVLAHVYEATDSWAKVRVTVEVLAEQPCRMCWDNSLASSCG